MIKHATFLAGVLALSTAACSYQEEADPADPTSQIADVSLADAVSDAGNLSTFSSGLEKVGLSETIDGPAAYTLLAPTDEAFNAMGADGATLMQDDNTAVLAAVIRNHILPGHVTAESLKQAIEDEGGPVTLETMGGSEVTVNDTDGALVFTTEDGASARMTGEEIATRTGVAIPIDALASGVEQS